MATLQWGSSGPDVEQLQQRLKTLNMYFGAIDGRFGPQTYAAVRRFQEANNLAVDGIVGPVTLAALGLAGGGTGTGTGTGTVTGTGTPASGQALSLHIGINTVDASKYGGWNGQLSGCENDARTMTAVAQAEGFTPTQLFSAQATTTRIKQEIARAAQQLNSGGFFFLTYAGHGGQAPDMTGTEEADHQDETWVCYDRQWLDDELQEALSAFRAGVNIVVLSDSCHSGTMYRIDPPAWMDTRGTYEAGGARQLNEQRDELQSRFYDLKRAFYRDMALPRPGPAEPPFAGFPRPADRAPEDGQATLEGRVMAGAAARSQATAYNPGQTARNYEPPPLRAGSGGARGGPGGDTQAIVTREIPYAENVMINREQAAALGEAKERTRSRAPVVASGVLGAGCEDNQLSQEVGGNGVFTTTLNRLWANNAFSGSYIDLINQIKAQMGPSQTPVLTPFGANTQRWATKTPFNV